MTLISLSVKLSRRVYEPTRKQRIRQNVFFFFDQKRIVVNNNSRRFTGVNVDPRVDKRFYAPIHHGMVNTDGITRFSDRQC